MSTPTYDLLLQALNERTPCYASYDGLPRYICPHIVGRKNGVEQALCWQYAGESSRGLPPGGEWKCLTVSKVSGLMLINEQWHLGIAGNTGIPSTCVDDVEGLIEL